MRKCYTLFFCFFFSCLAQAQLGTWTNLNDSSLGTVNGMYAPNSFLSCDATNQILRTSLTGCFGVQLKRYRNNSFRNTTLSGCDETYLSEMKKDAAGNVYVLFTRNGLVGQNGWVYKVLGDSLTLCDTSLNNSGAVFNNALQFAVAASGTLYTERVTNYQSNVFTYNPTTKIWGVLKGATDTLAVAGTIKQLLTNKLNQPVVLFDNLVIPSKRELRQWNGANWVSMGVNAGYLNGTSVITNLQKDFSGNLYGMGYLAATPSQQFRAKWNEATNLWEQLPYSGTNPYSDTCINFSSIQFKSASLVHGISKCTNGAGRDYVAIFNGSTWLELTGLNNNGKINSITTDAEGNVYACGAFTNSLGQYYVAKYNSITPAQLLQFTATAYKNSVVASWLVQKEVHVQQYIVQRSVDGVYFENVAAIAASGNTNYEAWDNRAATIGNKLYYRLQIVDKDGTMQYSKVMTVNFATGTTVQLFPNPAKEKITVTCAFAKEVSIVDIAGKTCITQQAANNTAVLSVAQLPKSVYFVRVLTMQGQVYTQKLVID